MNGKHEKVRNIPAHWSSLVAASASEWSVPSEEDRRSERERVERNRNDRKAITIRWRSQLRFESNVFPNVVHSLTLVATTFFRCAPTFFRRSSDIVPTLFRCCFDVLPMLSQRWFDGLPTLPTWMARAQKLPPPGPKCSRNFRGGETFTGRLEKTHGARITLSCAVRLPPRLGTDRMPIPRPHLNA